MTKKDNTLKENTNKKEKQEPKQKTKITEIKSKDNELENIIEDIQEIDFNQPTNSKIINPSLEISNINTLEQGLRDIQTETEDDNQDLAQYGIQDDYTTAGGDYTTANSEDDNQSYNIEPSLAMANTSQQPTNPMHGGTATGYPGTRRKKDKTYNPIINQETDEEKRKKRERQMW